MFFMKFFIYCKIWKCTFPFKLSLQVFCLYIVQAYNISLFLINQASILLFTVSCGDILIAFYYIARVFFEGFFLTMVNLEVSLYIGSRVGQEKKKLQIYTVLVFPNQCCMLQSHLLDQWSFRLNLAVAELRSLIFLGFCDVENFNMEDNILIVWF